MVSGEMFEPVAPRFASRHRVIVPDLRGHGRSCSLGPPDTVGRLADDLADLLRSLGIERTAVLGYSQGGPVALALVFDHASLVDRLVLACTYAYNMATLRETIEGHVVGPLLAVLGMKRFAKLVVSQGAKELGGARAEWLAGLMAAQDRARMATAWKEAMAFDGRPRLAEVRCPTLVVAGANDRAVPMHHARMLQAGIGGSRLVVVEGAGHSLVWTHPEELVRATEEFLAG
jgi:3-oxoadipate enol-lactonase